MDAPFGMLVLFLIFGVGGWMLSRGMDQDRIERYVQERGGRLLEKQWNPFGRGWYGDTNRVYDVRYVDADGNERRATCKTSLFSGVYWTEDEIVARAQHESPSSTNARDLEEENARLREELERLKRTLGPRGET